jgi:hypothetical protein
MIDRREIGSHNSRSLVIMLSIPNIKQNFVTLTIKMSKNVTKLVNRKCIGNSFETKSHAMGPLVNAVCQIARGCDK